MATITLPEAEVKETKKPTTKYVYFFGGGKADGDGKMKDVLGGKGAGLAEMTNAGLPVPPGFTIQTEACREYMRGSLSKDVDQQMNDALAKLESLQGQKLGEGENPLLVSVRSGAKFSMPGMMDTILNLGLNDKSVEALAKRSNNPRFAADSYRRLIQMFGNVVLDIEKSAFEEVFDAKKHQKKTKLDTDLDARDLQEVIADYKKVVKKHAKRDFPQDPHEQLVMARDAVFRSWQNDRAKSYRRINNIDDMLGTAVNVQAMVYGNLGDTSGTGVGFTRNPATGAKEFYGEFLMNAQGEDVVSGVRTPVHISELHKIMPHVYDQLRDITTRLEKHYRDMQDFEFTIQDGKLYMLQTRNGKRTGLAAVRVAIQMVEEGLLTKEEAIFRVEPNQLYDFLVPRLDEKSAKVEVLATGLPASPGAAVGQIVFTADEAVKKAGHGAKNSVILVRAETTPEDIDGMEVAKGILTSRGGMTSHAAVVTRGMGKCCVAGAGDISVDEKKREMSVKGQTFKEGDWISLDGTTGRVIKGKLGTIPPKADDPELLKIMGWADPFRKLRVRANADIPRDAIQARAFGAEGIGLCRTEHMFFGEEKIPHMRAMILADNEKDRRAALKKLLPMQRADFAGVFKAMDGLPVTIRTLDPPLHEFLPRREDLMVDIALLSRYSAKQKKELVKKYKDYRVEAVGDLKKVLPGLLARVEQLHEFNPMLGHRGCRLGITYPEITEMQARAIFEAAIEVTKKGVKVFPEVMIPLVATLKEMANQGAIVRRVAEEVFKEKGTKIDYMVGTMIELPRAALVADEIAKEAEFFSFGTNDLTQTTFGFSRDDVNKVLPTYLAEGILKQDPFAALDQEGVGQLVRMATERGRKTRPNLKVGICGEHGGEPSSVEFCHRVGLNYVSCSPFRVLTARLAAAQAAATETLKVEGGRTK
ncbi:Pyruvate, phosphate dikinase [Candidatus Sulfotelmatobacter kueseliae]|uniref:Pyruvate, phosphate dikinase n=1 Tax=Candidatus Sulfotelmatobacter kueseliae TaxID=2042962 RepID=A0A2U3KLD1_9BACT|nr:Pyruvate, phosphate dikinase [Candidatus Sulfotelmatobacter kueseliae]